MTAGGEKVDAADLKSAGEGRAGSSPAPRTNQEVVEVLNRIDAQLQRLCNAFEELLIVVQSSTESFRVRK